MSSTGCVLWTKGGMYVKAYNYRLQLYSNPGSGRTAWMSWSKIAILRFLTAAMGWMFLMMMVRRAEVLGMKFR